MAQSGVVNIVVRDNFLTLIRFNGQNLFSTEKSFQDLGPAITYAESLGRVNKVAAVAVKDINTGAVVWPEEAG